MVAALINLTTFHYFTEGTVALVCILILLWLQQYVILRNCPVVSLSLCLVPLPVRKGYSSVCPHVCLAVCLSSNLSVSYLFIYCLIFLSGIQRWLEARLPSFTVKRSADWEGHFSNGNALPLIFCLSLGVRLIYHASSPADIQIRFDWRLDGMTPTTANNANSPAALTHTHAQTHAVKCDALHTHSRLYSGHEYAYYANTYPLTFRNEGMQ